MLKNKNYKKIKREGYSIDLSEYEKETRANKIYDFIIKTHPSLSDGTSGVVEIRAINRDRKRLYQDNATGEIIESYIKGSVFPLIVYKHNQSNKERVVKELQKMLSKPYCMYYSIFSYDPNKEVKRNPKRCQKENSIYTECLVCDFDHIDSEEMEKQETILKRLGLDEYIKIFSGHGYQLVYLLKEKCFDKGILKAFTEALINNGLQVDSCIVDSARVMRLPYTHNNKSLNDDVFNPIETRIIKDTEYRYDLYEIFKKLNSSYKIHKPLPIIKDEKNNELIKSPSPIEELLRRGPEEDNINNQLFAICAYYKCVKDYSYLEVLDVVEDWLSIKGWSIGNREYRIQSAFDRATGFYGFWQSVMAIDYGEMSIIKSEKLILDNDILFNKDIKNSTVSAYIKLKDKEMSTGKHVFTKKDLIDILKVSERSLTDMIKELRGLGVLYIRRAKNKKDGNVDEYVIQNFGKINSFSSYSKIELKTLFDSLSDSELRVYMLLRSVAQAKRASEPLSFSLDSIANKLCLKKSRCSQLVKMLAEKEFIKIEKKYLYMGITVNQYTIY